MFPTVRKRRGASRIKYKDNIEVLIFVPRDARYVDMVECCQGREWYYVYTMHLTTTGSTKEQKCYLVL